MISFEILSLPTLLIQVNNGNTWTIKINIKDTIATSWLCSGVFIVNFEQILCFLASWNASILIHHYIPSKSFTSHQMGGFNKFHQKQPSRGIPSIRCSENVQQMYRRTPMLISNFNKVAKQLYWNHILAWVFSCIFAAYFQNTFFWQHLCMAVSVSWWHKLNTTSSRVLCILRWQLFCGFINFFIFIWKRKS